MSSESIPSGNTTFAMSLFESKPNAEYTARRDLVVAMANRIPGLHCRPPQGAFYCYIACSLYMGKKTPGGAVISTDEELVGYLLNECGVAVIPGTPFGMTPYIRVSFATAKPKIKKAFERIEDALGQLR